MADSCVREMDSVLAAADPLHSSGHNYKPPERQLRLTATGRSILRRLARVAPSCGEPIHGFRSARTGRQSVMSAAFELSTRLRAETVQGKLIRSGESTAVALRHATYYCELFERTDSAGPSALSAAAKAFLSSSFVLACTPMHPNPFAVDTMSRPGRSSTGTFGLFSRTANSFKIAYSSLHSTT